jgi:NAD(P)-dependent dehydrogenase (short-subunit alcohol dehydrogenase family)
MELIYNRKTDPLIILLLRICLGFILIAAAVSLYRSESIPYQIIFYVAVFLAVALITGVYIKKISFISCMVLLILAFTIIPSSKIFFLFPLLIIISSLSYLLLSQVDNHPLCIRSRKRKLGMAKNEIAVVTGANRGLGFEVCRQLAIKGVRVILSARNEAKGKEAAESLKKEGLDVDFHQLDVTDKNSIRHFAEYVKERYGKLDILINNAGTLIDSQDSCTNVDIDKVRKTFETNVCGALLISQELIPLMEKSEDGRIINISSRMGALSFMGKGAPAYRISKAALNALTRTLAIELKTTRITVNSVTPGLIKTTMGGEKAVRSAVQGADTVVWLAIGDTIQTGKFFLERKEIAW